MHSSDSFSQLIRQRYSCRVYEKTPIRAESIKQIEAISGSISTGPFGTPLRFNLVVATAEDGKAMKGLGTYGTIKDPAGFIVGAAGKGDKNLEDFGFGMETIILRVTGMGLGSCWLGGSFRKTRFAEKIGATVDEVVPAVAAIGHPGESTRGLNRFRQGVRTGARRSWEELFFDAGSGKPLSEEAAGAYAIPLEMVRLAPSSHNYQPWRIAREDSSFHFWLERTPGYGPESRAFKLLGVADLQRIDIGIAMCHFELTAREMGLQGNWERLDPGNQRFAETAQYVVTWVGTDAASL